MQKVGRYRKCDSHVFDSASAVGYVRCGVPTRWPEFQCRWRLGKSMSWRAHNPRYRKHHNLIRRIVRARRLRLWRVFADIEKTGTIDFPKRPSLARMFREVGARRIKHIIVGWANRLSADPIVVAALMERCRSMGVIVTEAVSGRDLTLDASLIDRLTTAPREQRCLARRQVAQLFAAPKRARGRKRFGSVPGEEAVLARLLQLSRVLPRDQHRRRGTRIIVRRSFRQIVEILNTEGVPTRTGAPWHAATIRGIYQRARPDLLRNWSRRAMD